MVKEARIFKALGEPTRLRIAALLAIRGETCVCHLAEALGEADFKISRHLGVLRSAGVVETRRDGTWMHYRLSEPSERFAASVRECLRDGLASHPTALDDRSRLSNACAENQN